MTMRQQPDLFSDASPLEIELRKYINQEDIDIGRPILDELNARAARDAGIAQAAEHAGPTWGDNALSFLTNYAQTAVGPFLSEDVVAAAERWQMAAPTDKRAWGSVFQTASKRGLIKRVGYGQARTSHLAAKPLWWRV